MGDRRALRAENTLLILFCITLASVFAALHFHGPAWLVNGLLGLCFLLAIPGGLLTIRRQWRSIVWKKPPR